MRNTSTRKKYASILDFKIDFGKARIVKARTGLALGGSDSVSKLQFDVGTLRSPNHIVLILM